jgi:hypothetical protein
MFSASEPLPTFSARTFPSVPVITTSNRKIAGVVGMMLWAFDLPFFVRMEN